MIGDGSVSTFECVVALGGALTVVEVVAANVDQARGRALDGIAMAAAAAVGVAGNGAVVKAVKRKSPQ